MVIKHSPSAAELVPTKLMVRLLMVALPSSEVFPIGNETAGAE